ncbi:MULTISPECIES: phenylacetic acid degradation protein PaaN [unclassified Halomonas]|uniref:phenylacetic acid degradation protein PaaN n=1 Tax=unclassified Halomonas TaxID=2609666 RepID=UPI0028887B2D|nr:MULTISPECIES: phenylacetic acid degradation protein PaaN [unclassified Halomonas]MDT0500134.1 phenylacetic acid degradation protein PaaN [Halomonas sp. PAR7]MDT0512539.1 phenylacetic acid degradation protein PaaN [Halomonas sp. LES1]MDT0591173.1 phenylacetic acid degradation protein PaaN [Halomonas sp. PAR8]
MSQQAQQLFERHRETLEQSLEAVATRKFWTPYPESIKQYPEEAVKAAPQHFEALLNRHFSLKVSSVAGRVGSEVSPYGFELGVTYDQPQRDALIASMQAAMPAWRDAGAEARVGVCLEVLARLNAMSPEIAQAVSHTSGQGPLMAFQAGGPHAQDRGLEAVTYAWQAMSEVPATARWVKPQGKRDPLVLDKRYHIVPRGISLVVACSTFPTWNTYPGLFASLATGNPVILKPHPGAVLPLAITARVAQEVLEEAGFDPCLVSLMPDSPDAPVAKELALDPAVKLIDFTGSSAFGEWLEHNATQARVFTEKAGINTIIIDSLERIEPVAQNLAFSLSLYSGQMCTTPQAIYLPRDGIQTPEGRLTFDEVAGALSEAIKAFLADNERACTVLGAIQTPATAARIEECRGLGEVLLDSEPRQHARYPEARIHTPLLLKVDASQRDAFSEERFGPIGFLIATDSTAHSIELARDVIGEKGAITFGAYTTDDEVADRFEELAMEVAVPLSLNLDGGILVNQSAAFSDFHATGGNPAANASLCDQAFVASRFVVVQSRRHGQLDSSS